MKSSLKKWRFVKKLVIVLLITHFFAGNQNEYISLKLMVLWCLHALHGAFTAVIKYFGLRIGTKFNKTSLLEKKSINRK